MKKIIALILAIVMSLVGANIAGASSDDLDVSSLAIEYREFNFQSIDDPALLDYIKDSVYTELETQFAGTNFTVDDVSAVYISKEYLEETTYNSKANVFFGYTLAQIEAEFSGERYVFTCENNETVVQEFMEFPDDTYKQIIKNVAIGTGVILICVTISVITAGTGAAPAAATAATTATKISAVFATSAATASQYAVTGALVSGVTAGVVRGFESDWDYDETLSAATVGTSEGYKWGAISGAITGTVKGIREVKLATTKTYKEGTYDHTFLFDPASEQAKKYPDGVSFTLADDGVAYPRFEEYSIATAHFDYPTLEAAANHTGLSGTYYWDAKLANIQCSFANTPKGYVWHHVEDMRTMILVPQDLHSVAFHGVPHVGGASLIKSLLSL